jgi:hypothetical protein
MGRKANDKIGHAVSGIGTRIEAIPTPTSVTFGSVVTVLINKWEKANGIRH